MSDFKPINSRRIEAAKGSADSMPKELGAPPPAADNTTGNLHQLADEAEANLGRLALLIDGLPQEAWRLPIPEELREEITAKWVAGPGTIIDILGYARDEEAFVFGRRIMRTLQEDIPTFEYLNFELGAAYTSYQHAKPQEHWAELIKNRTTWLDMLRDTPILSEVRQGDLPAEEGGARIDLGDIVRSALQRDRILSELLPLIRKELGYPLP